MSTGSFPFTGWNSTGSLPGLDTHVERESIYNTQVYTSQSGKEQRTSWWTTPRLRFNLTFNVLRTGTAAPAPWAAYSELGIVLKFLDDHRGGLDSFFFIDPYDGNQRTVRFDADTLKITRITHGAWRVQFDLISVL